MLIYSLLAVSCSASELRLPWIFTDHMVLQRSRPAPVWGDAAPGAEVRVSFGNAHVTATAASSGEWRVELPAQAASATGRELTVSAEGEVVRLQDVLVGEVWLCAGQSNMDFPLSRSEGGGRAAAGLEASSTLRLCNRTGSPGAAARALTPSELEGLTPDAYFSGGWQAASAETAARFSAVGFHFGTRLGAELDVPVGLIDVSVGGSTTEGWIPRDPLTESPALAPLADDYLATHLTHPFIRERVATQLADWISAGRETPRPRHFFEPSFLFDGAIESLAPFCLRGVLWYQGESNAHLPRVADRLFRLMVTEWRKLWSEPTLPFYYVQLPAMGRPTWPEFREVQASWLDIPHTGMAVAIDAGHPTDVHPTGKQPVGERLALAALAGTYGQDVQAEGPIPAAVKRQGTQLEIRFEHAEGLGWSEGGSQGGFEVSGADRRFFPAVAELVGDRVVLTSKDVNAPVDARYAWAPVPECGLVNGNGLPAAPFRTHDWRPVRVACIGDSITAGARLESPGTEAYPVRLQEHLGDGFEVRNFGRSGTCVILSTRRGRWQRAFARNPEHLDALCYEPQIVVSNLGINDIIAWPKSGEAFVDDYVSVIEEYRALPSNPAVLLWGPVTPLFDGHPYYGSSDEVKIHGAIEEVARRLGVATIDMNARFRSHPEWFPDHIHPNAEGAGIVAETVKEAFAREELTGADARSRR